MSVVSFALAVIFIISAGRLGLRPESSGAGKTLTRIIKVESVRTISADLAGKKRVGSKCKHNWHPYRGTLTAGAAGV